MDLENGLVHSNDCMIMHRNIIMLEDCTVGYLCRPAISAGAGQNSVFPVCVWLNGNFYWEGKLEVRIDCGPSKPRVSLT